MDKQIAKQNLEKLILKFKSELDAGKTESYNEESTKKSFIEPFLEDVLGWDVTNHDEVTMEEKVSRERVDYGIKLNNKVVFFVEAKPIRYELENAIPQAVKYCFNRKDVPFVLLTDFEGLMFFDATLKPDKRYIKKGLKIDLKWNEYLDKFDEIWQLSKQEVAAGSLEKLFTLKPRDRVSVDKSILEDLENWRESLAKNLYKNNKDLFHSKDREKDAQFLKEITQKILDRIIFIRFCEDRQLTQIRYIKPRFDERGENVALNTYTYILSGLFREYEKVFNSDLFKEQDWERDLMLDFKDMNEIIQQTYDPYMFDAIPIEVLGNIYEQYLGYTINLSGDYLKYELKPEVRKAGGVYYTPEYIVDYIVKNTVGKLLDELPEKKVKKLRILDPACGSGSFLIRAYEEMLKYYAKLKSKSKRVVTEGQTTIDTPDSETKLTIQEKAEILRNHIFGVDIDEQAVEVTKLSLMLKMLEGEWGFVKGTAVLPMLDKNIKCGNSLISGNVLELTRYFGSDYYNVKPFNWEEEFKNIMVDEGGFDVVIGNPPYVFARDEGFKKEEKEYFYKTYKIVQYQLNTYIMFTEKAFNLLKNSGKLGFIIPNNWLTIDTTLKFREFVLKDTYEIEIVNSYDRVFQDANVDTAILIFSKKGYNNIGLNELINGKILPVIKCKTNKFLLDENLIISYELIKNREAINISQKIKINSIKLEEIVMIKAGINAYEVGKGNPMQTKEMKEKRIYHSDKKINNKYLKYLDGKDVQRYFIGWSGQYIKYGKNLAAARTPDLFLGNRILVRQIPGKLPYLIYAALVKENIINDRNSMIIKKKDNDYDLKYILGIINSRLISYWFYFRFGKMQRKIFPQFKIKELSLFPIKPIDFTNTKEKTMYDKLCELVSIIIELNKKLKKEEDINEKSNQKQIEEVNKEIDNLVYELYGITEEEIKVIEGIK